MQNTHGSEVLLSKEMKSFEKSNFLTKNSYSFMKKAGYEVFKFIKDNYNATIYEENHGEENVFFKLPHNIRKAH